MSISTTKIIQQQAKGVATGFAADLTNTFISNLFKRKQQPSNILSRRDTNGRLSSIPERLYQDNIIKRPAAIAINNSGANSGNRLIETMEGKKTSQTMAVDWRVKLALGKNNQQFYSAPILSPLKLTGGVVFPYTPQLAVTHTATYTPTTITHANFQHYTYSNSDIATISITADFTAQNDEEAGYVLAVIHFFRTVTKMYFGRDAAPTAGTPPPILFLSAYGKSLFDRVPVVVTSFTSTFPSDADYYSVNGNRVPTAMGMQISIQPVYNRRQSLNFSLDGFANQKLLSGYI
jgi:hypothetical protein